ncbi:AbrB/MazE/SpoVT family DNA-binding domain-containing protein, partial [Azospirillum tabaci]|uniref:AbrB/MazE/SpoVT family DNA-binding domain-containing protein n=1 Tax=Azospirillum tabaci TaxID=2752310 RepID=UPI001FE7871C
PRVAESTPRSRGAPADPRKAAPRGAPFFVWGWAVVAAGATVVEHRVMETAMHISRLAADNRALIPQDVCDALGLKEGDPILFSVKDGQAVIRKAPLKAPSVDTAYLKALEGSLSKWASPEDDEAFDDL